MKKNTMINFLASEHELRAVKKLAEQAGISRSDVLRALIRDAEQKQLVINLIDQPRKAQEHVHG